MGTMNETMYSCHSASNPKYDQAVLSLAEVQGIDTTCVHSAEELFKKMRKNSHMWHQLQFFHHAIPIFNTPLKNATWFHEISMSAKENFKIIIMQISFSPELHKCECEDQK